MYLKKGCMGHAHNSHCKLKPACKNVRPKSYENTTEWQNGTERIKWHTGTRKKGTRFTFGNKTIIPHVCLFVYKTFDSMWHIHRCIINKYQKLYINHTRESRVRIFPCNTISCLVVAHSIPYQFNTSPCKTYKYISKNVINASASQIE